MTTHVDGKGAEMASSPATRSSEGNTYCVFGDHGSMPYHETSEHEAANRKAVADDAVGVPMEGDIKLSTYGMDPAGPGADVISIHLRSVNGRLPIRVGDQVLLEVTAVERRVVDR